MGGDGVEAFSQMIQVSRDVPRLERWGKGIRHVLIFVADWVRLGRRPASVVVFPDLPSRRTTLHKVCRHEGWELTNSRRSRPLAVLRFEDATLKTSALPDYKGRIFNANLSDISKHHLDKQHRDVLKYGVNVDPTTFHGLMLEKGDGNALHDGREVRGPVASPRPEKVYQRIINNRDESGCVVDLRLVYVDGQMPVTYKKFKADATRYTNETTSASLHVTSEIFSAAEQSQIANLMRKMDVDIAELDILRDADSDQIFIVDVNPTPWGPPAGLPAADAAVAISRIAAAFRAAFKPSKKP
jgi:hypothetical protein